jgi:hypothetical protein
MPADEASLVLYAPGLDDPRVNFKRKYKDLKVYELGHWRPAVGTSPEAWMILFRFKPFVPSSRTFVREPALEERVRQSFRSENIELGAGGNYENVLGEVEYLRFTRDGATECVFMRQFGDTFSDQRGFFSDGTAGHGNIMIRGYYCVAPFYELSQRTLRRFLTGIGLKGFGVPEKPRGLAYIGRSGTTEASRDAAFRVYREFDEAFEHKVFVRDEDGAWAWQVHKHFYHARVQALRTCHKRSKKRCRVYAAGDDIVWDMSEKEREDIIKAYSE